MNIKLMKHLMKIKQDKLHNILADFLNKQYGNENVYDNKHFIMAKGNLPIALVAHMDTVHKISPYEFFYDERKQVLWSPQGIGADDRAGIYAIIDIIESGYRPHIIFTEDEEIGGIGAKEVTKIYPDCPFEELKCIIELDRSGKQDCVFYECDNKDFVKYISSFGFKADIGSFSDISIIAPEWEVAAVNLSVGYYHEHSLGEYLNIRELENTIQKVKNILQRSPYMNSYAYIPKVYHNYLDDFCLCCGKPVKKYQGISIFNGMHTFTCCDACYASYFSNKILY